MKNGTKIAGSVSPEQCFSPCGNILPGIFCADCTDYTENC